jgi:hypothetical protein
MCGDVSRLAAWVTADRMKPARTALRCVECRTLTDSLATGWRAHAIAERDGREEEVFTFCPDCAWREFGALAWDDFTDPWRNVRSRRFRESLVALP